MRVQVTRREALARMLELRLQVYPSSAALNICDRDRDELIGKVDLQLRLIERLSVNRSGPSWVWCSSI